jgi:hypothetical protein
MGKASASVLDGFRLRTDAKVIVAPNRYRDERGGAFSDEIMTKLEARAPLLTHDTRRLQAATFE